MSDFVEQCRAEWRRLGVPDPLADEMAADLSSDLAEAAAEGVSAEELLGSIAFDPRSFAATWAAERGIIPAVAGRARARRRPLILVAFTAVAALALILTAVALLAGQPQVSVATVTAKRPHIVAAPAVPPVPPTFGRHVMFHANAAAPVEWVLLVLAIIALGFSAWLWTTWGRSRPPGMPA